MKIITKIFLITVVCFIFSSVVNAQRGDRVLYCNERSNVIDRLFVPRNLSYGTDKNGYKFRYLQWKSYLGNDTGNYNMRISSPNNFSFGIWEKSRTRGARTRALVTRAVPKRGTSGGRAFYYYDYGFSVTNSFSNGKDIYVRVYPKLRRTQATVSWYTTNCKKNNSRRTTPGSTVQCKWEYYGGNSVYGLGGNYYCSCRGRKYDTKNINNRNQKNAAERACGRIPGGSSELFMPSIKNNFLDWKRESNLLIGKKVFDTES